MDSSFADSESPIRTEDVEASRADHPAKAWQDGSPIGSISDEILILILDMVRDSFDDPDDLEPRKKLPIIASHVSRYWRSVALDNALWWASIMITHPWPAEAVETYLQRSKKCLLDIILLGHDSEDENRSLSTSEYYQRLLDLLFPHFPRCRALDIRSVFDERHNIPPSFLERFHGSDMPNLEKFIFEAEEIYYNMFHVHWGLGSLFASAPLLRDVRLVGIGIDNFRIPLSSLSPNSVPLTSLHLSRVSGGPSKTPFSELKTTLEACPSLNILAIYADVLGEWPGLSATCDVPSLESLYILSNMLTVSQLLLFLSAPKLKELVIAPVVIPDLSLLLSESKKNPNPNQHRFPALKSLTLAPGYSEAFEVVKDASACFPQIERLILPNLYVAPFTKVFTNKAQNDNVHWHFGHVVFPNLLDLALTDVNETILRAVCDMQVFRAQRRLPLRTVYVDSASFGQLKTQRDVDGILTAGDGEDEHLYLMEANLWEAQRRKLLHTSIKDLFVGGHETLVD